MKILIPVLGFGNSGGYRVLSKLADELIKIGHSVDFLSPNTSESPYYPTSAAILWADKNGNILSSNNSLASRANAISNQRQLTKAILKLDPDFYDIIIANHSLTTIPIKIARLKNKTLYYVQAYEPDFYDLKQGFKSKILKKLSIFSYQMKLFTVVNADIYARYKKLNTSRILYPGIDFNNFYPLKKNNENNDEIIIGTIGRLEHYKGTQYVLDAYTRLKKKFPRMRLYIAFGNPDDFVNYEGVSCFQPHGDESLGKFYRKLDYYFCAAYSQLGGFHYPLVEAMSCGVPLITTKYYPADDNNAWLAEPKNTQDLIDKFELAYSNTGLREKKVKQALMDVQQFKWELVGRKLNDYINELVEIQIKP